jgi:putative membrane protein
VKSFTLLAAAVALVPVAASAIALHAKTYVMKAGASDMFETEASKLVTDSANPGVASFAQMMIADHGKSTSDVMAAASADGLPAMTAMMTPKQKSMIDSLKRTSGSARDTLYIKDQIAAHRSTLMFQKQYAMTGDKPHLKDTAGMIVPVVEKHLDAVKAMAPAGVKMQ